MVEFFSIKIEDYLSKAKSEFEPLQFSLLVCYYLRDLDSRMTYAFVDLSPGSVPTALQIQFCYPGQIMCFVYRFSLSCR